VLDKGTAQTWARDGEWADLGSGSGVRTTGRWLGGTRLFFACYVTDFGKVKSFFLRCKVSSLLLLLLLRLSQLNEIKL
jgi:hypothetical protein